LLQLNKDNQMNNMLAWQDLLVEPTKWQGKLITIFDTKYSRGIISSIEIRADGSVVIYTTSNEEYDPDTDVWQKIDDDEDDLYPMLIFDASQSHPFHISQQEDSVIFYLPLQGQATIEAV
jgi:S-methylmethionine-dependent homocysteine/selenocysteine methylase